jgi:hypothetical protein
MAITSKKGHELGYIIIYFVVCKTTLELERVILTTLFLPVQKTPTPLLLHGSTKITLLVLCFRSTKPKTF